jgi:hypothetical protein
MQEEALEIKEENSLTSRQESYLNRSYSWFLEAYPVNTLWAQGGSLSTMSFHLVSHLVKPVSLHPVCKVQRALMASQDQTIATQQRLALSPSLSRTPAHLFQSLS